MSNKIQSIGDIIRQLRVQRDLPLRKISALLDIDTSLYSKIERNERKANKEQIIKLEKFFKVKKGFLMVPYLSERIYYELAKEDCASEALKIAENRIKYDKRKKVSL